MCGIAGAYSNSKDYHESVLEMIGRMPWRGPDSIGQLMSPPFFGSMNRLSINDLESGDQPLFNTDKSVALLYNGEIYNSPELRKTLESAGFKFRTRSDGEVICHLYDLYKNDFVKHLQGMYGISLWDFKQKKLILARDPQGEKPLYYYKNGSDLFYSSSIESFRALPDLPLTLNDQAIWDFPTFLWIPQPATIYNEVHSLLPGELIEIDSSGMRSANFRDSLFSNDPSESFKSDSDAITAVRKAVESSIQSQLLSDVPVGCFLSGGLDSSIISTIAAKNLSSLSTFTIGFENLSDPYHGTADESQQAQAYAKKLGTKHHTIHVKADDFRSQLDTFIKRSGQPFAVSSGLGVLSISEAARKVGIKVLLTGDGADELFGGYSWYRHFERTRPLGPRATSALPHMQRLDAGSAENLTGIRSLPNAQQAWAWHYYASEDIKQQLFERDRFNSVLSSLRHFHDVDESAEGPLAYIRNDRRLYLVNEMLQKADLMTMANSVEGRVPFVSIEVQKVARRLRYDQLVRQGELKWALRQAFADVLPSEIVTRSKHGFNVPIDHWLRSEWRDLLLHTFSGGSELSRLGLINKNAEACVDRMVSDVKTLHGHTLLCFIILNQWLEGIKNGNHC